MKLYKIISPPVDVSLDGTKFEQPKTVWAGTQAEARTARIAYEVPFKGIKLAKRPRVEVEEVDVPTDKGGLLEWLNKNATS